MSAIENRKLLIFTALQLETHAVARAFAAACGSDSAPVQFSVDTLAVELRPIGIRATRMPRQITPSAARCIIMAGLAGALDPTLRVGDIVIDGWPPNVPLSPAFRSGPIYTADHIVDTPREKENLHRATGALAVDMEARIVRDLARKLRLPFLSIRAISDTAAEGLDPAVLNLVDDLGRPKPTLLAGALLRRPGLIGDLRQLKEISTVALGSLANALKQLLQPPRHWLTDG